MIAKENKVQAFLSGKDQQIIIPVYQRNYNWTKQNCRQLIEDIKKISQNNEIQGHFIGSVVYITDGIYENTGSVKLILIDGQQRITTLTLIYIALYNHYKKLKNERKADEIFESYIINKYSDDINQKLKLKATENNRSALDYLIDDSITLTEYQKSSTIIVNYNFIKGLIKKENADIIYSGLRKLIFVEIQLQRGKDDPQKIFESLNSTGLELNQSDLIRNYLLMDLTEQEQEEIYTEYWEKIEKLTIINGKRKTEDFMIDYLTIKRNRPSKSNVFHIFREESLNIKLDLKTRIKELLKYAELYNKLIDEESDFQENDLRINEEISNLRKLDNDIINPLVLSLYNDYIENKLEKYEFLELMKIIQSFIIRRFICNKKTTEMTPIFSDIYHMIDKNNYVESFTEELIRRSNFTAFPTDEEFEKGLKEYSNINFQGKTKMIYFYEKIEGKNVSNNSLIPTPIFPVIPTSQKTWFEDIDKSEQEEILKLINGFGNYTLKPKKSVVHKNFKIALKNTNDGYIYSNLWIDEYVGKCDVFESEQINENLKRFIEKCKSIWNYPENVDISKLKEKYNETNIFDINNADKKPEYFIINSDSKSFTKSWEDMYRKVFNYFLIGYPNEMKTESMMKEFNITDIPVTEQYEELNDNLYISTEIKKHEILENIKRLLRRFSNEDIKMQVKLKTTTDNDANTENNKKVTLEYNPSFFIKKTEELIEETLYEKKFNRLMENNRYATEEEIGDFITLFKKENIDEELFLSDLEELFLTNKITEEQKIEAELLIK